MEGLTLKELEDLLSVEPNINRTEQEQLTTARRADIKKLAQKIYDWISNNNVADYEVFCDLQCNKCPALMVLACWEKNKEVFDE